MESSRIATYDFVRPIQSGSYGSVLEVTRGGQSYAIKEFKMSSDKSRIIGAVYLNEADFLKRCDHPNILKLISITYGLPYHSKPDDEVSRYTCDNIYLVMPLAKESLYEFIRSNEASVPMLKRFMVQLVDATNYLHVRRVGHRDLKSSNVLIFQDEVYPEALNVKLCDFGMCKQFSHGILNSDHVGTLTYKAPELLMGRRSYFEAIDVWGLGVMFFEMFNKLWPFDKQKGQRDDTINNNEVLTKIFINRGAPSRDVYSKLTGGGNTLISFEKIQKWAPKAISDLFDEDSDFLRDFELDSVELPNFGSKTDYINLLEGMLCLDPTARLTMPQIVDHPFFTQVPKDVPGNDIWRDLCLKHQKRPEFHILTKTSNLENRKIGILLFEKALQNFHRLGWRILFQGWDIFERCLLYVEHHTRFHDIDIELLAYSSFYLAAKLFLNDDVPQPCDMIPGVKFERSAIIKMEQTILMEMLEWEIYRQTVYDLVENKNTKPKTLWVVMTTKDNIYGHKIDKIAAVFTTNVK